MTSQIFDICGFIKSAKIKYLENKVLVFCQIKSIHDTLRAIIWQKNNFLLEVPFIRSEILKVACNGASWKAIFTTKPIHEFNKKLQFRPNFNSIW